MSSPNDTTDEKVFKKIVETLTTAIVSAFPKDVALAAAEAIPKARPNPRVGVSVLIQNENGQFLVGERKNSHGAGTVQTPGGHIDYGEEDLYEVAKREVKEETALEVTAERILTITNDVFTDERKHYITIWIICTMDHPDAEPERKEPEKCEWWTWMSAKELADMDKAAEIRKAEKKAKGEEPEPPAGNELFLPLANLLKQSVAAKETDLSSFIASTVGLKHVK